MLHKTDVYFPLGAASVPRPIAGGGMSDMPAVTEFPPLGHSSGNPALRSASRCAGSCIPKEINHLTVY